MKSADPTGLARQRRSLIQNAVYRMLEETHRIAKQYCDVAQEDRDPDWMEAMEYGDIGSAFKSMEAPLWAMAGWSDFQPTT
ncbi:hypothetical protein [Alienimonas chondri]|uniref:hypothetical protein n=1 Tax=Alienimonas chondri TaxID=2681879 RepID=UPI0014888ABB|nr:hypothetical protein [Alienimonas chondri]